jgi:anti-sigma-K factor RskA
MDYAKAGRADALAAQYVAGTLRGPARSRFEALLPGHPALQRAVNEWQDRLMPLTTALPETPPPARVWRDIEARLFAGPNPLPSPQPWWQRVAAWRVFSGLALAAVVGLLVSAGRPTPAPVLVVLQSTGAAANASGVILASLSGDGGALVTRPLTKVGLTTACSSSGRCHRKGRPGRWA